MCLVFEFAYIDKKTKQRFKVYARTEKVANEIIEIVNKDNIYYFVKPRFRRFKKAFKTTEPPYDLEEEQKKEAKMLAEYLKKWLDKMGLDYKFFVPGM